MPIKLMQLARYIVERCTVHIIGTLSGVLNATWAASTRIRAAGTPPALQLHNAIVAIVSRWF